MSVGKSPFDGPFATYHLLPHQNGTYDIGAPSQQFKNLYLSGNATIGGTLSFGSGGGVSAPVGGITEDVAVGLTAAGTVIGDALQLAATINRVDTAAAGTGVKLLGTLAIGQHQVVKNLGANDINLFPPDGSGVLDAEAAGAALVVAVGEQADAIKVTATDWIVAIGVAA